MLWLLDLHSTKHHLQQVFYPYWQIPIVANRFHDRIMNASCFGKNSSYTEQCVYVCWYLQCDRCTLISGDVFYFSFVFSVGLLLVCLFIRSLFTVTADKESSLWDSLSNIFRM